MNHETWMAKAIEEALSAARDGEAPAAAIVVQRHTVLGVGRNTKTSERCGFAHAELNALLAAKPMLGRRPDACVLYSTLEPCAMCLGAITFAGIRTVVIRCVGPRRRGRGHVLSSSNLPHVDAADHRRRSGRRVRSAQSVADIHESGQRRSHAKALRRKEEAQDSALSSVSLRLSAFA